MLLRCLYAKENLWLFIITKIFEEQIGEIMHSFINIFKKAKISSLKCFKPNDFRFLKLKNSLKSFLITRCTAGYTFNESKMKCEDIDECDTGEANCDIANQACLNTIGSFKCLDILNKANQVNQCEDGFRYQARIDQCVGEQTLFHPRKLSFIAIFSFIFAIIISINFERHKRVFGGNR